MKKFYVAIIAFFLCLSPLAHNEHAAAAELYDVIYDDVGCYASDPVYIDWITRAILYAAGTYGTDPLLVTAVMEAESGFDMTAVSRAGATGLLQLMPDTAVALGVDRYNALENVIGGAIYLANQVAKFSSWGEYGVTYAVAAYNAGPQAVIDYGGMPPYAETYNYCTAVANNYQKLLSRLER